MLNYIKVKKENGKLSVYNSRHDKSMTNNVINEWVKKLEEKGYKDISTRLFTTFVIGDLDIISICEHIGTHSSEVIVWIR